MTNFTLTKLDDTTYETECGCFAIYHRSELDEPELAEGEWFAFETCGCGELFEAWGDTAAHAYRQLERHLGATKITSADFPANKPIPAWPSMAWS